MGVVAPLRPRQAQYLRVSGVVVAMNARGRGSRFQPGCLTSLADRYCTITIFERRNHNLFCQVYPGEERFVSQNMAVTGFFYRGSK